MDRETVLLNRAALTPTGALLSPAETTMPPEMLRDASVRLGWAGLIYAVGYFFAMRAKA